MELTEIVKEIADVLKEFDSTKPKHKYFKPGIGPFGEPQLIKIISELLTSRNHPAQTKRVPDMIIENQWAIEFKIVRPFGDNGNEAENWSVNLLHPYEGNTSLIGDAFKLSDLTDYKKKAVFVIGYEHEVTKISLDPLIDSFELIAKDYLKLPLGKRIEERRNNLVHPVHQVLRCISWEVKI